MINETDNSIGEEGATKISEVLKMNKALKELFFANRIGDSGAEMISEALNVNTTLSLLDLCSNTNTEEE